MEAVQLGTNENTNEKKLNRNINVCLNSHLGAFILKLTKSLKATHTAKYFTYMLPSCPDDLYTQSFYLNSLLSFSIYYMKVFV